MFLMGWVVLDITSKMYSTCWLVNRRTWQHMVRLYAQTVGDGTGSYPVRITHPEGAQTPQRV